MEPNEPSTTALETETRYRIIWENVTNGRRGRGTLLFSKLDAEKLAANLNEEFPHIKHTVEPFS